MNQFVTSPKGAPLLTSEEDRGIEIRALPPSSLLHIYMHFMRRWKWVILGCIGAGALIALFVTLLMEPQYTAATTIEISREEARVVNVDSVQPKSNAGDQEFYQTQYGLLVSQSLAERIAKELNLGKDAAFLKASGITPPAGKGTATDRNLQRRMGSYLLTHVTIVPARLSQLVTIRYTSPDPELSARIANMWAQMFIRTNIERRYDATAYARTFLVDRLADLRTKLDTSERALVQYAGAQSIVNVGSANVDGKQTGERPIAADNLVAYNTALNEARAARISAETALRQAERSGASTTSSVNNQAINSLRAQRAEVSANYAKLRAQFEGDYPPLRAAAAQLQQLDRSIASEEGRVVGSLRSEFAQATARESALSTQVEGLKGDLLDLRRRSIQYNILQREVDTNRTLYDGLLQRYKEIGIAGGIGTNNVSIIDQANPPGQPSSPRPLINLVLGMLAGLIIGSALSLALDQIDEKITDPAELERVLGVPSLGVVPKDGSNDPIAALGDPRSVLTEAYLTIKTNLQFTTSHGFPTTMLVSSTRAAEGKSTTALALAMVLSRQKRSVVLVDADMRSPSVHALIGVRNDTGLSNILSGNTRWQDVLVHESGLKDVKIIVAGPHPPNSADLLSGPWLQTLISELAAEFDHVIFDAPPMLGLADAALIAPKMEGVVYVVEAGGVPSRAVKLAVNRMLNSGANLMGIVLTKFISNKASYGYGYDYGYGYGSDDGANKR